MFNQIKNTPTTVMVLFIVLGVVFTVMGWIPTAVTSQIAKIKTMIGGTK